MKQVEDKVCPKLQENSRSLSIKEKKEDGAGGWKLRRAFCIVMLMTPLKAKGPDTRLLFSLSVFVLSIQWAIQRI